MKLEDQVVSLELAKKLKELGVKQESLFWHIRTWGECSNGKPDVSSAPAQYVISEDKKYFHELWGDGCFSAFTVAELGEFLKKQTSAYLLPSWEIYTNGKGWRIPHYSGLVMEDTEADARAKMLIYLIANNLITV